MECGMSYNKPLASTTNYGVMKVGSGLAVTNGIVSTTGTGSGGDVGYFYSNLTQLNTLSINTVTLSNTTLSQGVVLTNGSRLNVSKSANYTLQVTLQFAKSTSAGIAAVGFFWLRKNGIDVADSATDVITTSSGAGVVLAVNYTLPLLAGEYLEMVWSANTANSELIAIPAQAGPPVIPAAPSVRMTLLQV
jgi:hypothetical protein